QPHLSLIEAGRGARVWEEFVEPDLGRLSDEAWTDLVLEDLAHHAAELVGEEIAETGRWAGAAVRAVARTVKGRGCLAALARPDGTAPPELAAEMRDLAGLFPDPVTLLYAPTGDPEA